MPDISNLYDLTRPTDTGDESMAFPKIDIHERKIILLSGFRPARPGDGTIAITDQVKLEEVAGKHRDAIAFGYVSGRWVPAA